MVHMKIEEHEMQETELNNKQNLLAEHNQLVADVRELVRFVSVPISESNTVAGMKIKIYEWVEDKCERFRHGEFCGEG